MKISLAGAGLLVAVAAGAWLLWPTHPDHAGDVAIAVAAQPAQVVPTSMGQAQLTFAPVVKRVAPAVVNVYTRTVVQQQANPFFADPFFQQFFGRSPQMRERVQRSLGSGVIARPDGVILTNNHVVAGASEIVVALNDKREFKAKLLFSDARTDLAVLKIETKGEKLPTIPFGNSDQIQVGDLVLAIGDPFGVGQTVTMGIVSALARSGGDGDYQFFIQTDAAINPGNSGGALITSDGRLAGINTAIVSRSGGNIGIGFAIPANLARRILEGALGGGVKLPWIGAEGQAVTAQIASSIGLSRPGGVVLKNVYPGGPAARAGLKVGDVILTMDGVAVDDMQALNYRIATHRAGDAPALKVSANGQTRDISVKLEVPPETPPRETATIGGENPMAGAKVQNLSPSVAAEMQMGLMTKGVVIVSVAGDGIANRYGFQPGDIVRSINGARIERVGDLVRMLNAQRGWDMVVERDGRQMSLSVR